MNSLRHSDVIESLSSEHLDMNPVRESTIFPLTDLHTGVRDGDHLHRQ